MKYAVALCDNFEFVKGKINNFSFYEDGKSQFFLVEASSKEEAVKKYLSYWYEDTLHNFPEVKEDIDKDIMEAFVKSVVYGDDFLENYESEKLVLDLTEKIQDYYTESLLIDGKIRIYLNKDEQSYSTPSEDLIYIEKCLKKFPASQLINLLTEKEIKQAFIEANLYDTIVIELTEL